MKIRCKVINIIGSTALPIFVLGVVVGRHWIVIISMIIAVSYLILLIADLLTEMLDQYREEKERNHYLNELEKDAERMHKQMEELNGKAHHDTKGHGTHSHNQRRPDRPQRPTSQR
jgi:hypothetical protein